MTHLLVITFDSASLTSLQQPFMPHSCRQNRLPDSKKRGISPLIIQKRSLLLELRSLPLTVIRVKALGTA